MSTHHWSPMKSCKAICPWVVAREKLGSSSPSLRAGGAAVLPTMPSAHTQAQRHRSVHVRAGGAQGRQWASAQDGKKGNRRRARRRRWAGLGLCCGGRPGNRSAPAEGGEGACGARGWRLRWLPTLLAVQLRGMAERAELIQISANLREGPPIRVHAGGGEAAKAKAEKALRVRSA